MGTSRWQAREALVHNDGARLHVREVGEGRPVVVLHGGPDFDHQYLLPELDLLADSVRLVYYDQRGRGQSFDDGRPDDVTIDSEVDDLDAVRRWTGAPSIAVLGHSWGTLLGLEYAIRHLGALTHLILMNPVPVSHAGAASLRRVLQHRRTVEQRRAMAEIAASERYRAGDLDAEAAYYRIHYAGALRHPEQLDALMHRLRARSTVEGVVRARAIEDRLYQQTWSSPSYDLTPRLHHVTVPTLVLHGHRDFIPPDTATHVAQAMPGGQLVVLPECGHFAFLEQPALVRDTILEFLSG